MPMVLQALLKEKCATITIKDVTISASGIRQDVSFLINNFALFYSNSISIVNSKWLQDYNSKGVLLNYRDYLILLEDVDDWIAIGKNS